MLPGTKTEMKSTTSLKAVTREVSYFSKMLSIIGPTLCARRVESNVENASNRILVLRAKVSGTAVWPKKKIYYKLLKGNMGLRVVLTSEETISARGQSVFFSFK